jgi:hypothetical protein
MDPTSDPASRPVHASLPVDAPPAVDTELSDLQSQMVQLQTQGQNGAGWFYWVAGLSLVNSVIALVGGGVSFVVGLGITGIADGIATVAAEDKPEIATIAKAVAFGFSLIVSAVVVGFGWLSNKRIIPIFALGMFLYLLDGLLFVLGQQWLSVAFHGFALFNMWQGLNAYRQLNGILRTAPAYSV